MIHLSISCSILPSLMNKTPRYLNSSTCGRNYPPIRRGQAIMFSIKSMSSDLEGLILISAALHLAVNHLWEKEKRDPLVSKPDSLWPLTAARNLVHGNNEQDS
ncbi:hypothetical protein AMECASPLE_029444 [Ameca splendens]|uniref:Uncharacterized protein n=1 Tax=Ameca splendens TaxID=208324 RepID=A0ABV0XUN2_9TELE